MVAPGGGLEPPFWDSKSHVLPLDDPGLRARGTSVGARWSVPASALALEKGGRGSQRITKPEKSSSLCGAMGSLIKKRRKRMRKKKHKKMLKRTRWQRRTK